ncbi:MAG TPA: hypothetical protein VGF99_10550 [Myxococcota bacterium]
MRAFLLIVLRIVLLAVVVWSTSCATVGGPLRHLEGYATIEACDTAPVDLATGIVMTGCFDVVESDVGDSGLSVPDGTILLGPAVLSAGGCESLDCRLPLATTTTYRERQRLRWWTPLSSDQQPKPIDDDVRGGLFNAREQLLQLVWSDGVAATRMCLRRHGDRWLGDVAAYTPLQGTDPRRGSIVVEKVPCNADALNHASIGWREALEEERAQRRRRR